MDFNKIVSGLSTGVLSGLAALGGVAWKAYQGYTANQIKGNKAPATEPKTA
jgi:uncharacterized membrane protein YebE (DUF533 family)